MAGAAIGLTGAAIQILLCVLWAAFILKRARARGEGFRPSGEAVKAAYRDEDEKKAAAGESQVGIPLLLALIPPVVLLLVLNVCKLDVYKRQGFRMRNTMCPWRPNSIWLTG